MTLYADSCETTTVLSQGEPRDAAVNFDTGTYRILQRHRGVSLAQHGFLQSLLYTYERPSKC